MVHLTTLVAVATVIGPALAAPRMDRRSAFGADASGVRPNLLDVLNDKTGARKCLLNVFKALQDKGYRDQYSYAQLAGIHGYSDDNNSNWIGDVIGTAQKPALGFCTHAVPAFPTWHRPYLLLFETACQSVAKSADGCSGNFKMPYWDWAQQADIPDEFLQPTIDFNGDGNNLQANPLYSFRFPHGAISGVADPTNRPSDADSAVQALANSGPSIQQRVYTLFTTSVDWDSFSNKAIHDESTPSDYNSLESIHDMIHSAVGGQSGTMTFTTTSAFDPIFWFHHCNVDRLFAIWQALFSDVPVPNDKLVPFPKDSKNYYQAEDIVSTSSLGYTYADATGGKAAVQATVQKLYGGTTNQFVDQSSSGSSGFNKRTTFVPRGSGPDSYASPAADSKSDPTGNAGPSYHSGSGASPSPNAGHSYNSGSKPGFSKHDSSQPDCDQTSPKGHGDNHGSGKGTDMPDHGNNHGKGSSHGGLLGGFKFPTGGKRLYGVPTFANLKPHIHKIVNAENQYNDYTCNVQINSKAFDGSFKILFYIGDSCKQWSGKYFDNDDYVGFYTAFGAPKGAEVMMDKTLGGTVPFTNALLNLVSTGDLEDLSESTVTSYLKDHMCYKILDQEGKEVDAKDVKGLGIHVVSSPVTLPKTTTVLPKWGKYNKVYSVYDQ